MERLCSPEEEEKSTNLIELRALHPQKWEKTKRMVRVRWGWQVTRASWRRQKHQSMLELDRSPASPFPFPEVWS